MPFLESTFDKRGHFDLYVKKYLIPSEEKKTILEELENFGISDVTVYYDLDSLSRSIKKKYQIDV